MSDWFYKISIYAAFLPILVALYRYKFLNNALWWYWAGLLVARICGIVSIKLGEQHINNHFMIYINAAFSLLFIIPFFHSIIHSKSVKKWLFLLVIIYVLAIGYDVSRHGFYINPFVFGIYNVIITIYSLICLNQLLKDDSIESLRELPVFWLVVGTLIYAILDFFLTISNGWLYAVNRGFFFLLWDYITPIFIILKTFFNCIGFWITKPYFEKFGKTVEI